MCASEPTAGREHATLHARRKAPNLIAASDAGSTPERAAPSPAEGARNVKESTWKQRGKEAEEGAVCGHPRTAAGERGDPIGRDGGAAEEEVTGAGARCRGLSR